MKYIKLFEDYSDSDNFKDYFEECFIDIEHNPFYYGAIVTTYFKNSAKGIISDELRESIDICLEKLRLKYPNILTKITIGVASSELHIDFNSKLNESKIR